MTKETTEKLKVREEDVAFYVVTHHDGLARACQFDDESDAHLFAAAGHLRRKAEVVMLLLDEGRLLVTDPDSELATDALADALAAAKVPEKT